ncbi:MAG: hypothetical protein ACE5JG_11090 [Planctomycetota bacterium]
MMVQVLRAALFDFCGGDDALDDITLLAFRPFAAPVEVPAYLKSPLPNS